MFSCFPCSSATPAQPGILHDCPAVSCPEGALASKPITSMQLMQQQQQQLVHAAADMVPKHDSAQQCAASSLPIIYVQASSNGALVMGAAEIAAAEVANTSPASAVTDVNILQQLAAANAAVWQHSRQSHPNVQDCHQQHQQLQYKQLQDLEQLHLQAWQQCNAHLRQQQHSSKQQCMQLSCQQPQQQWSQQLQQLAAITAASRATGSSMHRSWSWPWNVKHSNNSSSCGDASSSTHGDSNSDGNPSMGTRHLKSENDLAAAAALVAAHPALRAYLQGSLGLAFSGGGFRYTYFIGVLDVLLHELGIIAAGTPVSGASCGALIAVFAKSKLSMEEVTQLTREFSRDCATNGVKGRLGLVLRHYLQKYLPDNAHKLCDSTTYLAVTKVWPSIRTKLYSSFPTRNGLISAIMASCHLPSLSDGTLAVKFKGRLRIDGGLLSIITPPPGVAHTVLVCSMPSQQIKQLPSFISRPKSEHVSISPDNWTPWPFTRSETAALALQPPTDALTTAFIERGRADARSWAESVGLTLRGKMVWPTADRLRVMQCTICN